MPDLKSPISILRIAEFLFAILVVALATTAYCTVSGGDWSQFMDGTTIGFLIISTFTVIGVFLDEDFGPRVRVCVVGVAAILYLIVGGLLINAGVKGECSETRSIAAGSFALFSAIAYIIELALSIGDL